MGPASFPNRRYQIRTAAMTKSSGVGFGTAIVGDVEFFIKTYQPHPAVSQANRLPRCLLLRHRGRTTGPHATIECGNSCEFSPEQVSRCPIRQPSSQFEKKQRPIPSWNVLAREQNKVPRAVKILDRLAQVLLGVIGGLVPDHR